jgi:cytochrome c oxidase assembly protein subunit 15
MVKYSDSLFARLVAVSLLLSLVLIVLSSIMRLSNQGLGCAGWPECFGYVDVVKYARDISVSSSGFAQPSAIVPPTLVERAHRFVASILLIFIIAVAIMAWRRHRDPEIPIVVPLMILGISLFLALVGIWYGSPLMRPPVIMVNLLGGIALLGLFWWLCLSCFTVSASHSCNQSHIQTLRNWAVFGLVVVVAQTALGGWMSSHFAALGCTTFPDCNGAWWPEMNFSEGFAVQPILTVDGTGKVIISPAAAISIHIAHRMGAGLVLLLAGWLGYKALKLGGRFRTAGVVILTAILLQVLLGIAVVKFSIPLAAVVSHSTVAALLWLGIITLIYYLYYDLNEYENHQIKNHVG